MRCLVNVKKVFTFNYRLFSFKQFTRSERTHAFYYYEYEYDDYVDTRHAR